MAVSLELLTDEDILDYSRSDGQERVLTEYRDINLNFGSLKGIYHGGIQKSHALSVVLEYFLMKKLLEDLLESNFLSII